MRDYSPFFTPITIMGALVIFTIIAFGVASDIDAHIDRLTDHISAMNGWAVCVENGKTTQSFSLAQTSIEHAMQLCEGGGTTGTVPAGNGTAPVAGNGTAPGPGSGTAPPPGSGTAPSEAPANPAPKE